jgi:DNA-binding NarL/FixJ family response regulator
MNICIVDDHILIGQLLKGTLSQNNAHQVEMYTNAADFLKEPFEEWMPDIVLTDLLMPDKSGIEMIEQCKDRLPNTKFIILTSVINPVEAKNCIRRGASGFLTKDVSETELMEGIKTVYAGNRYISRSMKDKLMEQILAENTEIDMDLTKRETEILQLVCSGKKPKDIAQTIFLSQYTVQHHIGNIMKKMKVNRTTELVLLAIQKGLYRPGILA